MHATEWWVLADIDARTHGALAVQEKRELYRQVGAERQKQVQVNYIEAEL